MPQLGPEYDLAKRIDRLERNMGTLLQGLGQAFSATQSDGSVGWQVYQDNGNAGATAMVFFQGPNTSVDPQTGQHPVLLYIGQIYVGGEPSDSAAIFYYPSGSPSATIGAGGVGTFDPQGNVIGAIDSVSAEGIGRPWLPINNPAAALYSLWPSTASTTTALMAETFFNAQQPKVYWNATLNADAGTTGEVQLVLNSGGSPTAATPLRSVAAGGTTYINDVMVLPQPFWNQSWSLSVMGRVTGGTGSVRCQTFELTGRQS